MIINLLVKTTFFGLLFYLLLAQILSVNDKKLKQAIGKSVDLDLRKGVGLLGTKFTKYFNRKGVEKALKQAGNPWSLNAESFIGFKIILPVAMALVQIYLKSGLYYLFFVSILCFFLPDLLLILISRERKRKIKEELPDVVDIFESAVGSGLDVGAVFFLAADYVTGKEFKKELSLLAAQYSISKDKEQALADFQERIDMYDTDLIVLALMQDTRTGKAQEMLESLALVQTNNMVGAVERKAKAVEYRVSMVCSAIAVSLALMIFYPYFAVLSLGMNDIFK